MRRVFRDLAEYTRSLQPLMDNGVRYSRCALLDACIKYPIRFSFSPRFLPSARSIQFTATVYLAKDFFHRGQGGCWICPFWPQVGRGTWTASVGQTDTTPISSRPCSGAGITSWKLWIVARRKLLLVDLLFLRSLITKPWPTGDLNSGRNIIV